MFGKNRGAVAGTFDVSAHSDLLSGAQEFMRVWAAPDGPATCFISPARLGADPFLFGIVLVDCLKHGAKAYAQAVGISEDHALARIWEGFEAERNAPTDTPTEVPPKGEMN
jgi:hypothetical protein